MYLSYSGFSKYISCGFAYWNDYVNKTPKDGPDDRLGSIYGSVVGKLFEDFYNLKLWKDSRPQDTLIARVGSTLDKVIESEVNPKKGRAAGVLLWKGNGKDQNPKGMYANKEEIAADIRDTIPRAIRAIRQHRLLGVYAEAEVKLDFKTSDGHILAGRSDFIIRRYKPHEDLVIIDGKGSKYRDKYVDPKQLTWYGMLYNLRTRELPNKTGFLFWRSEVDKSIDWQEISDFEVEELLEEVMDTIQEIQRLEKMLLSGASPRDASGVFKPRASKDNCRFCPYASESVCSQGYKILREE